MSTAAAQIPDVKAPAAEPSSSHHIEVLVQQFDGDLGGKAAGVAFGKTDSGQHGGDRALQVGDGLGFFAIDNNFGRGEAGDLVEDEAAVARGVLHLGRRGIWPVLTSRKLRPYIGAFAGRVRAQM